MHCLLNGRISVGFLESARIKNAYQVQVDYIYSTKGMRVQCTNLIFKIYLVNSFKPPMAKLAIAIILKMTLIV